MNSQQRFVRWLWVALGALGILDTAVISSVSNMNEGVVLPAILGLPLLIYGIFYFRIKSWMKKGFGLFVKILFIAGYCAFIAIFTLCSIIMGVSAGQQPQKDADAIIILGGGIRGDEVTLTVKSRLDTALGYIRDNPTCRVVVSGGQGHGETITEASAMAKYLIQNGVDKGRIIQEDRSTSTMENFAFSKALLDKVMGKAYRAVFVTNEFHIYRAGLTAEAMGIPAQGLPSPSPWYLIPNNYLRETLAIVKTWVFGVSGS